MSAFEHMGAFETVLGKTGNRAMESPSVIPPKKPSGAGWVYGGAAPLVATMGYEGHYWRYPDRGLLVISAVEVAHDPHDIAKGPEYHVSVSKGSGRCDRNEARFVRKAFGMEDAEEDNHVPHGRVRNFWLPVAERLIGHECRCKAEEPAIVEDQGDYVWRGVTS